MKISKIWIWSSGVAAFLMAMVSGAGIFITDLYSKETTNWAAQGIGQDIATFFLVFPALSISLYFVNKGSLRAMFVWLGLLMYAIYSYVIYSFFVHFGLLFLVYIAILGLSFYSFAGGLMELDWDELLVYFSNVKTKSISVFLMIFSAILSFVWLSDIFSALFANTLPQGLADTGLPINPIHVMDLAFFLPAAIMVSVSLWKKKKIGLILAAPLLSFIVVMATTVLSVALYTSFQGFPSAIIIETAIGVIIAIGLYLLVKYLKEVKK